MALLMRRRLKSLDWRAAGALKCSCVYCRSLRCARVWRQLTKIAHRLAARHLLPKAIVDRPKRGFQIPFPQWSRGIWRDRVERLLLDGPHLDVFRREGLEKIWRAHLGGREGADRYLFALVTVATWFRTL